jgi:DNA-binding MarR family transcriptional regulator
MVDKELSELELLVMRAFDPTNPLMCVHQIFKATAVPYGRLTSVLGRMQRDGYLERVKPVVGEAQYKPTEMLHHAARMQRASTDNCGLMVGLTEEEMSARVVMLKRMKRLLIVEWHPTIDVLLGDYERNLSRLLALRESVSPEDFGIEFEKVG